MEFSADTKSLAEALDQVEEAVEKKSTIPILSHVLIEATANGLRLAATDLELGIRTFCPAQVKVPGSVNANSRPDYPTPNATPRSSLPRSRPYFVIHRNCVGSRQGVAGDELSIW